MFRAATASEKELKCIYRKIIDVAVDYDVFLMHGAVVATNEQAFMFTAPSGTGKTTHVKQWLKNDKKSYIVNGDKPLIKITNEDAFACGTPWSGNEHMNTNSMVPLKAIVLMERNETNHIEAISFAHAYRFLIQQTYIPSNVEKAQKTLNLLTRLGKIVSFYKFQFNNFSDDCFTIAYQALVGKES